MYFQIVVIMLSMIIAYVVVKMKYPVEWSILAAALAGGIVGTFFSTPPISDLFRHLVEGTFTYMDIVLVFTTATIFMAIVKESGGVDYVIRATIKYFYNRRIIALLILMFIILIPGALTGAGSVSCLVVGAPVALALIYLGIPRVKVTAIIFILAGLSAAAPPVNIWAMITCAGTAIPYVGFELPLAIPILFLGTFTILFLGYKKEGDMNLEQALKEMPETVEGMNIWKVSIPFIVFFGLVVAQRIWPYSLPIMGLPFEFTIAAIVALVLSPKKINILQLSSDTIKRLLPLLATVIIVGILQQVMTVSGVRGMLSYAVITIPLTLLFISLAFVIPISEGVLTYGGAALLGIPLTWYFDSIGLHATVVIAGLSLLYPLGDGLPPTALIGRLSVIVSDYKGSYWTFLKQTLVPWVVITVVGILMVVYSSQLSFLVEWSK
ncbi:MAG: C4-dicarboxylate ABC transporter [Candidatus Caldatribacteriota bacterium]|nr:C4-dicarboxylate ABC transporter [Atribacterota bacterium]MDD4289112.1 C4-dicarboxylate ABC transporter [Atribacterota bacterium]MDD4764807.1 C4-dicarboxylate ABC transporter [Atribacterota bacterium]MDD5635279.1 C4-dicarboxylate ABC transporter [Atribacterota bacterium]MDI9597411.1 C4-dicarboxylate ABC transporter [Atribacterota bacterium]